MRFQYYAWLKGVCAVETGLQVLTYGPLNPFPKQGLCNHSSANEAWHGRPVSVEAVHM